MTVRDALRAATPSMRDLAEETGIVYSTLRAWSAGNRTPSPEGLRRLADELDRRGSELGELAGDLRDAADQREGQDG